LWGDVVEDLRLHARNQLHAPGAQFLGTFKEFPPSQKAGSFSLDQVLQTLSRGAGDK
jgi:hypothetical protein